MITDAPYQGRMICTVYFRTAAGGMGGHVTEAKSVFEACRNALDWFRDTSYWKGPVPEADTVLKVRAVSRDQVWYVRAGNVSDQIAPGRKSR